MVERERLSRLNGHHCRFALSRHVGIAPLKAQTSFQQKSNGCRAYLELLHRQVRKKGYHAHIYDPPAAPYLNNEAINGAEKLFDEAERLADDDTIRFRVQVARVPIWYVTLTTNRVTGDAKSELLRRFLSVARKAGISNISEGRSLDDWAKRMGAK
ncbi:MAG: hypothetical protein DME21_03075 [Verrucomicrobia bacterium]|nr:MAG: hypothetical protein DME21_03075 [Verrucomicrobiota bacterium]